MEETTPTPDPYLVLGIAQDADLATIKQAFRRLVLEFHPDKVLDESLKAQAQERFYTIRRAYETVSDPDQRERYHAIIRLAELRREQQSRSIYNNTQRTPRQAPTSQQGKTSKETEREAFVAFALKLFDESQNEKKIKREETAFERTGTDPVSPVKGKPHSLSIEEEIKERNLNYEKLKANVRSSPVRSMKSDPGKPAKKETLYAVPIDQLNLEPMSSTKLERSRVDIVAVHGLGAIPDITWKEKKSGINWLSHETMLPNATPEARILRFGYDSLWMGKTPVRTSLSTIAYKLLLSLSMLRVDDVQRPLIFIGHCFGGLVIERALNLAKMQQNAYPGVFDSSVGVIFLGTPHRGTKSFKQESALLAAIAASSDLSQNLEIGVLDSMTSDSGALLDVADDFISLCQDGGPLISCFFEQRSSKLGKVIGRNDIDEFIVDHTSATFDGHRKYGLELDHFSLNKFDGPNNPNYIQVRAEIRRFYQTALAQLQTLSGSVTSLADGGESRTTLPSSVASTASIRPSKAWNRLTRQQPDQDLRHSGSSGRPGRPTDGSVSSRIKTQPSIDGSEDEVRKAAIKELQEEEDEKLRLRHEEEIMHRHREQKKAGEQQYLDRLKKNMLKYGVANPDEILAAYPLPNDENLSEQEIRDKDKWHRNLIKGELSATDLDGGQIDEILNDTGQLMIIDDVETTFTKVAKKWVSTQTLDRYNIPWQKADDDESALIIKRWVPNYELEFIWDHSQAIRENRGRRDYRDPTESTRGSEQLPEKHQEKDLAARMMDRFKDLQKNSGRNTTRYQEADREYVRSARRYVKLESERDMRERQTQRERRKPTTYKYSSYVSDQSDDDYYRVRFPSKPISTYATNAAAPPGLTRSASHDSVHSAPDVQEVNRRRQNSRALSRSQERVPIARTSGEFSRRHSQDERMPRRPTPSKLKPARRSEEKASERRRSERKEDRPPRFRHAQHSSD